MVRWRGGRSPPTIVALLAGCGGGDTGPTGMEPRRPGPLVAVTEVAALRISETQIGLHWKDANQDETGTEIHRSATGASGAFMLLATVGPDVVDYVDAALGTGTDHCYRLRAIRVSGSNVTQSEFSSPTCEMEALTFTAVAAGGAHTCGLVTSGSAWCWGRGESGQLGVPSPSTSCQTDAGAMPCSKTPLRVGGNHAFTRLAAGAAHTCGLSGEGIAWCWGGNSTGQLGDGSTSNRSAPAQVNTDLRFSMLDAGAQHSCGLTADGAAWCWGSNVRGQLGDGTTTARHVPVAVSGGHTFRVIAAGGFSVGHTCGVDDTGKVWCWGDNESGQLGNGSPDDNAHSTPGPVSGDQQVTTVTAGLGGHSCSLTAAGAAWCWGENAFGALGDGTTIARASPVAVAGGLSFTTLIAGGFLGHTCGLLDTGAAWCWGENERGQVGDGSTTDRSSPRAVAGGLMFRVLDAGFRHTCGLSVTAVLYCWGSSGAGQLGNGTETLSAVPARVFGQPQ